ncbi:MAG: chromosome partitioning protein [Caulobacteraceae bacterium]|nr:MAG: chromosome partitioning protein [Caulobacteraceae bacterium]
MKTLSIVSTKGGVGKTTLAVHIAVAAQKAKQKTLVIDLDPQGSAAQWAKDRVRLAEQHGRWFDTPLDVRRLFANDLVEEIAAAKRQGYQLVIIDTPPHADFPAARAVEVADLVLMPVRPGYFDLHAAKATINLVHDMRAHAFFVVNQTPHTSPGMAADAASYLASKDITPAPVSITMLQPYVRALRDGLTAPEIAPEGRSAEEINALWSWLAQALINAPQKKVVEAAPEPAPAMLDDPFARLRRPIIEGAA